MRRKYILTEQQTAQITEHNARWIEKILSTDAIDVAKTKRAMNAMHRAADLQAAPTTYASSALIGAIVEATLVSIGKGGAIGEASYGLTDGTTDLVTSAATDEATLETTAGPTEEAIGGEM